MGDAINKEMHNFGVSFEMLENDTSPPVGWGKVTVSLVSDM